jgi:hypothetical protein
MKTVGSMCGRSGRNVMCLESSAEVAVMTLALFSFPEWVGILPQPSVGENHLDI